MTSAAPDVAGLPTDPGSRLRRQREQAGLTEQQVAEQLNLDAGIVQSLERNDYGALGAPVYVRGHLRRYSTLVGADVEQILSAYDRSSTAPDAPTLVPSARATRLPERRLPAVPWAAVGTLVVLAVVGGVGWYGFEAWRASRSTASVDAVPSASPAPVAAAAAPAPAGQVAVAFAFSADSWVEVYDASGRTVVYDLGKAGTQRIASGAPPLRVTLGNAPAVAMDVNGRRTPVPAPAAGSTVTRFAVAEDGTARPVDEERT